jgi:hypothetical protein
MIIASVMAYGLPSAGAVEIKTDVIKSPQKMKNRLWILSAKNPNTGWMSDEKMCDMVRIIVANAIEIESFAQINGIMGFKNPV